MRILVTGAAGFIGQMVVEALAQRDTLLLNGTERRISAILANDMSEIAIRHRRVHPVVGPLSARDVLDRIISDSPDLVIHLAAVVSGQAEADFDLGMALNLQSSVDLIKACRAMRKPPVFVFASSVAVFSCDANDTISDDLMPAPRSSYGTQKLMVELLVRDGTRKGFILGRSLRFPTVAVRQGLPNGAASSFASGIIREPLAGKSAILPVSRDLRLHLASPERALAHVLHAAGLAQDDLGFDTTLTLPGLSVTVGTMLQVLADIAGPAVANLVTEIPDPAIQRIVASWPGQVLTPRTQMLGFEPDRDFADLVRAHMALTA